MKKSDSLYFVPAAVFLLLYGGLGIAGGFGAIDPKAWIWVVLLAVAGVLLFKRKWWGCIFGIAIGIDSIYMSTRYTGQVINIERPVGILLCIYYLFCGFLVFRKCRK